MTKPKASEKRPETAKEWARRVIAEHGPPPKDVVDFVNHMRQVAAANLATRARDRER